MEDNTPNQAVVATATRSMFQRCRSDIELKLRPGRDFNVAALVTLIETAYTDMKQRVQAGSSR